MPNRMETAAARTAGKIHGVAARMHGLTGVFKTLASEHAEMKAMFDRVVARPDRRAELWPAIRKALVSHERGELNVVYPVLYTHAATQELARAHEMDAKELESLIDKLDMTDIHTLVWERLFDRLVGAVTAHAEREEKEIFPIALEALDAATVKDLDAKFKEAQRQIELAMPA